jgi:hypothetical protein
MTKVFFVLWFFSTNNGLVAMDHYDTLQECEAVKATLIDRYKDTWPFPVNESGESWFEASWDCIRVEVKEDTK